MPGSIPGSATVEPWTAAAVPLGPPRRRVWRRALARPAGRIGAGLTLAVVIVGALAPWISPADPFAVSGPSLAPPGAAHLLGTDALGRDVWSGIAFGARTSLVVAFGVGTLVLALGGLVGGVSGYAGGLIDDVLMRFTELVQALPRFFLALLAIALFGPGLWLLILVLGLTSWTMLARVIRAEVLSLAEREFVTAARVTGMSAPAVLLREILPNALPAAAALLGLIVGRILLIEASLGFLGLGDPNVTSWGALAGEAQAFLRIAPWLSVFPGLAILVAVLGVNLLGEALTDALGGR